MCTADGLVVFLAVRPRAPFVPAVWLLPFQHAPSLATGSHLTCKGTEPSEEPRRPGRGWEGWGPAQLCAARWHCQPSQAALGKKPYTDICPALAKILKHLLSLGSLSLQPDLVRLPCESQRFRMRCISYCLKGVCKHRTCPTAVPNRRALGINPKFKGSVI